MRFDCACEGLRSERYETIDNLDSVRMKKVYCACGCIVDLDESYMSRRLALGKDLECVHCRNTRISREIDEINNHFMPATEEPFF